MAASSTAGLSERATTGLFNTLDSAGLAGAFGVERSKGPTRSLSTLQLSREYSKGSTELFGSGTAVSDKEAVRAFVQKRRGEHKRVLSCYDCFDEETEGIVQQSTDVTWCLEKCGLRAADQDRQGGDAVTERNAKKQEAGERRFGLPDFSDIGFSLSPPEETEWHDHRVREVLGFQVAVHRKTSIERLCLVFPKSGVPPGLTKEQLQSISRNLKRCDHANVLKCYDVCEDTDNIYFMYEHFVCVTLLSVLETHSWNQLQVVNMVREICSALGFASSLSLSHLGWSLCHILLAPDCVTEDPHFAKLCGFGLMGNLHGVTNHCDFMCWSPEAVEAYQRVGDGFAGRLEPAQKIASDLWSIGTIVYSIIARRPPMVGSPRTVQRMVMGHDWAFNVNFDEFDMEAKQLIEGLMLAQSKNRMKADIALYNPWIRRRWKPPPFAAQTFCHLEDFCVSPLPKRLFGRFLVKFLHAEHMRTIATRFYSLDTHGDGAIDAKDLRQACKDADRPASAVDTIMKWMIVDGASLIPLSKFAESMAEEVIDGKALRHSFECLDDDGSEAVSAEELYEELVRYDSDLTLKDIIDHIAATELVMAQEQANNSILNDSRARPSQGNENETPEVCEPAEGGGEDIPGKEDAKVVEKSADHKLDFDEYIRLFPGRMKRIKLMDDRIKSSRHYANEASDQFELVKDKIPAWLKALEEEQKVIYKFTGQLSASEGAGNAVRELRKHLGKVGQLLAQPPGPTDFSKQFLNFKKKKGKNAVGHAHEADRGPYGFDSFVQDHAKYEDWPALIEREKTLLKHSVFPDSVTGVETIDYLKASDAANQTLKKLEEVSSWVKLQVEEYTSIIDVLADPEPRLKAMVYSSRGLQKHGDEEDEEDIGGGEEDEAANAGICTRLLHGCSGK